MAVTLTIDIDQVLSSRLVMDALGSLFGTDTKAETVSFIDTLKPGQLFNRVQESTQPTHVRFINPDDSKTSKVCRAVIDGTHVWPIGSNSIQVPPLHVNCRSILAPFRLSA